MAEKLQPITEKGRGPELNTNETIEGNKGRFRYLLIAALGALGITGYYTITNLSAKKPEIVQELHSKIFQHFTGEDSEILRQEQAAIEEEGRNVNEIIKKHKRFMESEQVKGETQQDKEKDDNKPKVKDDKKPEVKDNKKPEMKREEDKNETRNLAVKKEEGPTLQKNLEKNVSSSKNEKASFRISDGKNHGEVKPPIIVNRDPGKTSKPKLFRRSPETKPVKKIVESHHNKAKRIINLERPFIETIALPRVLVGKYEINEPRIEVPCKIKPGATLLTLETFQHGIAAGTVIKSHNVKEGICLSNQKFRVGVNLKQSLNFRGLEVSGTGYYYVSVDHTEPKK